MRSTYSLLGFPETLSIIIGTVAIGLTIAPYVIGLEIGGFKIGKLTSKVRRNLRIAGPIILFVAGLLFAPFWPPSERIDPKSKPEFSYQVGAPPSRNERWLRDLGWNIQAQNLAAGLEPKDFEVLVLETIPTEDATREFTLALSPVEAQRYSIEDLLTFRATNVKTRKLYEALSAEEVGSTYEIDGLILERGDSIIFIIDLRKSPDTEFPTTAQLRSTFKVNAK